MEENKKKNEQQTPAPKISKIGQWLLSGKGKELGWKVSPENMKYVLK